MKSRNAMVYTCNDSINFGLKTINSIKSCRANKVDADIYVLISKRYQAYSKFISSMLDGIADVVMLDEKQTSLIDDSAHFQLRMSDIRIVNGRRIYPVEDGYRLLTLKMDMFNGYDKLIWLDGDTVVNNGEKINELFADDSYDMAMLDEFMSFPAWTEGRSIIMKNLYQNLVEKNSQIKEYRSLDVKNLVMYFNVGFSVFNMKKLRGSQRLERFYELCRTLLNSVITVKFTGIQDMMNTSFSLVPDIMIKQLGLDYNSIKLHNSHRYINHYIKGVKYKLNYLKSKTIRCRN